MRPVGRAIDRLRARFGAERPVEVIHTDLPSNDFASLFGVLHGDPSSYLANRREIPPRPMPFRSFLKKRDRGTFRAPRWLQSSS